METVETLTRCQKCDKRLEYCTSSAIGVVLMDVNSNLIFKPIAKQQLRDFLVSEILSP